MNERDQRPPLHLDFYRLWAAQAVSSVGARITREGLPLTAVLVLHAPAPALGALAAMSAAPSTLVGLMGGGAVDRTSRRGLLIGADLGRAAVLLAVPAAALAGHLSLVEVFFAAAVIGALSDLYDIADHAYLPSLVDRAGLLRANARLSATESIGEIGGPALAGALVSLLTAPIALVVNAATYLMSAAALATIRHREAIDVGGARRRWLSDAASGLSTAWAATAIRPLLLITATSGLFGGFFAALYVIYAINELGLSPFLLGLTIAVGGLGALIGAALSGPIVRRLGLGPALIVCMFSSALSAVFIPLAYGGRSQAAVMLMLAQLFGDGFATAALIYSKSLRQTLLPVEVLGRVGGAFVAVGGLAAVAGALAGGELGQLIGERLTLAIACAGLIMSAPILLASPLRRMKSPGVA
jgi:hypothetical protein